MVVKQFNLGRGDECSLFQRGIALPPGDYVGQSVGFGPARLRFGVLFGCAFSEPFAALLAILVVCSGHGLLLGFGPIGPVLGILKVRA